MLRRRTLKAQTWTCWLGSRPNFVCGTDSQEVCLGCTAADQSYGLIVLHTGCHKRYCCLVNKCIRAQPHPLPPPPECSCKKSRCAVTSRRLWRWKGFTFLPLSKPPTPKWVSSQVILPADVWGKGMRTLQKRGIGSGACHWPQIHPSCSLPPLLSPFPAQFCSSPLPFCSPHSHLPLPQWVSLSPTTAFLLSPWQ